MAKILILIGAHLCTAPRPQKEADSLVAAGHDVVVRGVWFDPVLIDRDRQLMAHKPWRFQPVLNFQPSHWVANRWVRFNAKVARHQFQHGGRVTPALLGYGTRAMLHTALREQADLTIVHSEAGLWVGAQLLQRGYRVGVDFEDWFSQDLLPTALVTRPVAELQRLERDLMQQCSYRLTTSQALAETLATVYDASPPTVIYNLFPPAAAASARPQVPTLPVRLHWFSQTIGPGRGLETLFQALPDVLHLPVEVHLRGHFSDATRRWLDQQIPAQWRDRVCLQPTIPQDELPAQIAQHEIGLALEQPDPPSRNLTITNKLFQYLQAGLAVIGTDTAGQQEVWRQCPEIGRLIPAQNPRALATAIADLVQHPMALQMAQQAAQQAMTDFFTWDQQRDRLIAAADLALRTSPG